VASGEGAGDASIHHSLTHSYSRIDTYKIEMDTYRHP
jgi:hypothetical protein